MRAPLAHRRTVVLPSALLAAGLLVTGASAQKPGAKELWRLAPNAFVEYRRIEPVIETKAPVNLIAQGQRPAPGFYEHEVTKGKTVAWHDQSLFDLLPQLALSLSGWAPRGRARTKVSRVFEHTHHFGAIKANGAVVTRSSSDAAHVVQTGTVRLKCVESPLASKIARNWRKNLLEGTHELEGTEVEFVRIVDAVRGLVLSFEGEIKGEIVDRRDDKREPFSAKEKWKLVAVRDHRWRGFQARVDAAIANGCAFIDKQLDKWTKRGSLGAGKANNRSYGSGRLALLLLTLVKGEPDKQKPRIQELLGKLRERDPIDTYSLGCALMALEAYYAPANEAEQLRQGLIDRPHARTPTPGDLELMRSWTKRLLDNVDTRVDRGYLTRFNYVRGRRYDNSVTQYGVLGLYSAALCGVEIPANVWLGLTEHYLRVQSPAEGEIKLRLPRYGQEMQRGNGSNGHSKRAGTVARARRRKIEAAGYGYASPKQPTGSMTCAGLTGLGICRAMLVAKDKAGRKLATRADEALASAFAWIAENYDVRYNPRHHSPSWFHYYLYGLERGCEISGVARIGVKDWYWDGAMQLLATQRANGSWGKLQDTCFAILFLKKAVAPVLTGR